MRLLSQHMLGEPEASQLLAFPRRSRPSLVAQADWSTLLTGKSKLQSSAFLCGPQDPDAHAPAFLRGRRGVWPSSYTKEENDEVENTQEHQAEKEASSQEVELNPECSKTRKSGLPRCCLCANGEAIWSQDGSCKHCKDNGGIKDCAAAGEDGHHLPPHGPSIDSGPSTRTFLQHWAFPRLQRLDRTDCTPGSSSWPLKYKEVDGEDSKEKDWNEEDDNRGAICAETCAEKWISKINGEMNIPRALPPQKAKELTKQAEAAEEQEKLEREAERQSEMESMESPQ
ncbi:unnamed protein product [Durusdinium trenchii]|uniref:Uncharacterized protein n=2 Tax=Durusdinium trenchii TaxID=1381693 RepID=A0ABP0J164_9DINO